MILLTKEEHLGLDEANEKLIKALNTFEKTLLAAITRTVSNRDLGKYQSPLKKIRQAVAKDRDVLLKK